MSLPVSSPKGTEVTVVATEVVTPHRVNPFACPVIVKVREGFTLAETRTASMTDEVVFTESIVW